MCRDTHAERKSYSRVFLLVFRSFEMAEFNGGSQQYLNKYVYCICRVFYCPVFVCVRARARMCVNTYMFVFIAVALACLFYFLLFVLFSCSRDMCFSYEQSFFQAFVIIQYSVVYSFHYIHI